MFPDRRNLPSLDAISPDVLISHDFFRHYVWTMDFDERKLYLRPAASVIRKKENRPEAALVHKYR